MSKKTPPETAKAKKPAPAGAPSPRPPRKTDVEISKIQKAVKDSVGKAISKDEIAAAKKEQQRRDPNGGTELLNTIFKEWGYTGSV